jgi:RNA polymerase sigma-70 factor, ECF subfamily
LAGGQAQLTELLEAWSRGDPAALDKLTPLIYGQLRKLAKFHMSRERPGHTLQPTALINEAFLRLVSVQHAEWKSRGYFYAAASQIMRRVLVDYARKKRSAKRGREAKHVPFEEALATPDYAPAAADIVAFDEALTRLKDNDARKAQVLELWFFGGMTIEEIAEIMEISISTIRRDLDFAKVWLARELGSTGASEKKSKSSAARSSGDR